MTLERDVKMLKLEVEALRNQVVLLVGALDKKINKLQGAFADLPQRSIWITNGIRNRRWYDPGHIPEGYRRGKFDRGTGLTYLKVVKGG